MCQIIKSRGSKSLAGAASLKYRMPMVGDHFRVPHQGCIAQSVEQQTITL